MTDLTLARVPEQAAMQLSVDLDSLRRGSGWVRPRLPVGKVGREDHPWPYPMSF